MRITPIGRHIGARIDGVSLAALDDAVFTEIERAFHQHGVIAISGQQGLSERALIDFSRRLGELELNVASSFRHPDYPQINILSNRKRADGSNVGSNDAGQGWHTDMSYNPTPARASILYAIEVPTRDGEPLGDTLFSSMVAAGDTLPADIKARIENLSAVHDFQKFYDYMIREKASSRPPMTEKQKAEKPPVVHPLVVRHPFTGQRCLYADPGYTIRVLGLSERESDELLQYLFEFQTRPEFHYRHKWRAGDVLIWDNVATIHMATGGYRSDEPRYMLRTQVLGDAARYRAANASVAAVAQ